MNSYHILIYFLKTNIITLFAFQAYSSFEKKVKNVQNKLEEIQPDLDSHSKSVANLLSGNAIFFKKNMSYEFYCRKNSYN